MTKKSLLFLALLLLSSLGFYQGTQNEPNTLLAIFSAVGIMVFFILFVLSFVPQATVSKENELKGQVRYRVGRHDLDER